MGKLLIKFNLPVSIIKEGKKYVAYTPALDLSTSGCSKEEAKKHFEETVDLFFEELLKKGTIDEVLRGLGWEKREAVWNPPTVISNDIQSFCVSA